MRNLDLVQQENAAVLQAMHNAIVANDQAAFAQAFGQFAENLQQSVLADARELVGCNDAAILAQRGIRQLTSEERTYFQKLAEAMGSSEPKQALTSLDVVLPETELNAIFDDLREAHPLLDAIDFTPTGAITSILMSTSSGVAGWGTLTKAVTEELGGAFSEILLNTLSLTAYIPVSRAMLALGPNWLERWVREVMAEAIAVQAEAAFVDGDGKDKPVGLTRALTGAVDGVYPRKVAVVVTALDPATMGTLLNTISQGPNSKRREIPELMMVVNHADYYAKVFPATTVRRTDGTYSTDVFPYPTRVFRSAAVPSGKAVFGLGKAYFAALGTSKGGKVEYSDEYKFLERQRVYLIELWGNGRPKDANAFIYADISNLVPAVHQVYVTNADSFPVPESLEVSNMAIFPDARLASLTIGSLTLTPPFNKSVMNYAVGTTNATNTVTAVAKDGEATVEIKLNGSAHTNGTAATWQAGENTVEVTVTKAGETETYTVTVTKS